MIKIEEIIYDELRKQDVHESCGFILGIDEYYCDILKCKNIENRKDKFEVGLFDKIKLIIKMISKGYNNFILFHVHKNSEFMSNDDILQAKNNSCKIIISQGIVSIFKIFRNNKEVKISVPMYYAITREHYEIKRKL